MIKSRESQPEPKLVFQTCSFVPGGFAIVSLFVGCCVGNTISWEVGFTILLELLGQYKSNEMITIKVSGLRHKIKSISVRNA